MSIMCSYQNCLCVKYPCSSIAFFHLPSDNRRSIWIKNSGNKALKNISAKAHRFFCENHFRQCDIRSQFNRKILRKHAVPIEYSDLRNPMLLTNGIEQCSKVSPFESQHKKSNTDADLIVEKLNDDTKILQEYDNVEVQDQNIEKDNSSIEEDFDKSCPTIDFYLQPPCAEDELYEANYSKEDHQSSDFDEIFYEDSIGNRPDSSTVDLQFITEDVEVEAEVPIDNPKPIEVPLQGTTNYNSHIASSSTDYEEDRHFALSLVGYFQRLPKDRRALAKLKILQYLTDLDIGLHSNLQNISE